MRHNMNKGKDELNDLGWTGRIAEWTRHNTNKGKDEPNDLNDRQVELLSRQGTELEQGTILTE